MIPGCFPNWGLVYYYFTRWENNGVMEQVLELLRDKIRKKAGRCESSSLVCIDSQSIKTTRLGGECRGFDSGKMTKGRKLRIVTDTMGLLLAVVVHAANVHNSKCAFDVIALLKGRFEKLVEIGADGGCRGELTETTKTTFGWILEIVLRSYHSSKFSIIHKRWVVERTFAWVESY